MRIGESRGRRCVHSLVGLLCLLGAEAEERRPRFLFISSPTTKNVYFVEEPSVQNLILPRSRRPEAPQAQILVDGEASLCRGSDCDENSDQGLQEPTGIAVHEGRDHATLYVADTGAQNIYAYEIAGGGLDQRAPPSSSPFGGRTIEGPGKGLQVGKQRLVRQGVQGATGLAVDGEGNLFYTLQGGQIEMVRATDLEGDSTNSTPVVLYSASESDHVSTPVDITTDGFHLYWANQAGGPIPGTVAAGPQRPETSTLGGTPRAVTANGAGAVGVCTARKYVFYTAESASLYAVKDTGGSIAEVSRGFGKPRGCAFDGEATLYVADEQDSAIYSLPAVSSLRAVRHLQQVASVEAPSHVAVFSRTGGTLQGPVLHMYAAATRACGVPSQAIALAIGSLVVLLVQLPLAN